MCRYEVNRASSAQQTKNHRKKKDKYKTNNEKGLYLGAFVFFNFAFTPKRSAHICIISSIYVCGNFNVFAASGTIVKRINVPIVLNKPASVLRTVCVGQGSVCQPRKSNWTGWLMSSRVITLNCSYFLQ